MDPDKVELNVWIHGWEKLGPDVNREAFVEEFFRSCAVSAVMRS